MNKFNVVGKLARDVWIKENENGKTTGLFTLKVRKPFKSEKKNDFINLISYDKTAINLNKYCKKDDLISVVGRITPVSYEKNGETVYEQLLVAEDIGFLHTSEENNTDETDNESDLPM